MHIDNFVKMVAFSKIIPAAALAFSFVAAAPTKANITQLVTEQPPSVNEKDAERLVSLLADVLKNVDENGAPLAQASDDKLQEAVNLVGKMLEDLGEEDAVGNENIKRELKYYDFKDWPEEWKKNAAGQFNDQYVKDMKDHKINHHVTMYYEDWVKVLSDESLQIDLFALAYPSSSSQQTETFLKVLAKVECILFQAGAILKAPRGCPV